MEALALDVKCYESFEQLVGGEMLMPEEGSFVFFRFGIYGIDDYSNRVGVCTRPRIQAAGSR